MAKLERTLNEDFDRLLARIDSGILNGSVSASHEDGSDFAVGGTHVQDRTSVSLGDKSLAVQFGKIAPYGRLADRKLFCELAHGQIGRVP